MRVTKTRPIGADMRFVVIASMRTGSTFLVHNLDQRPDVRCHGEVFNYNNVFFQSPFPPGTESRKQLQLELKQLRTSDPHAFIERIYGFNGGRPHTGFKMFMGHNEVILNRLVADHTVGKIVLRRFNVLAQYSSALAAKATGAWAIRASRRAEKPLVTFHAAQFIRRYERFARFYTMIATALVETGQSGHIIWTEELNDQAASARLLDFLGAESSEVKARETRRRPPTNILARFANPNDVERFLARNGLEHWAMEAESSAPAVTMEEMRQMKVQLVE